MDRTEKIWQEYHARLHGFIRSRVNNISDADDILQEVFIRIQSRISTLKNDRSLESWIYQITRNSVVDYYRASKRMAELPPDLAAEGMAPGEKTRQEIASCLMPMIQSLPDHYREVLILSEIEGLPQSQVAEKIGLSLSGVKSRIQRGRAKVKDLLLACCWFEFDHQGTMTDYEGKGNVCDSC